LRPPSGGAARCALAIRSYTKPRARACTGTLLLRKLVRYCRERGLKQLWGSVMTNNSSMLQLAGTLGFRVRSTAGNSAEIKLDLQPVFTSNTFC
jgi:acetyltransferase